MRALFALFVRSLREDARARLPPILRATLVLVILLILWTNASDFAHRSAPGREFLGMVLFANLGLLAIAAPGIFASAITEEKEDQTLTLLRMTKLSPLAILLGKSTTRLIGALLLLLAQIPFTLLAVTLGGVSRDQVLGAYAVLGATTFLLCNLALLCSVICRTNIRAGIWTGSITALLFGLLPLVCIATALRQMRPGALLPETAWETISTWVIEGNPVYVLTLLLFETTPAGSVPVTKIVLMNVGAGLLCFFLSWLIFDRFCATAGEIVARRRRTDRWSRGIWQVRSRPSIKHHLAWKDFYFLIGGLRGLYFRLGLCALIFLGAYAFERWVDHAGSLSSPRTWKEAGEVLMVCAAGMLTLELGLAASRIFGEERRNLTLGSLVTLPRTTGWLIRQKFLGCFPVVIPSIMLFEIGLCLAVRGPWNGYEWWMQISDEWIPLFYVGSQTLLLPILIANLSLRIRRGAMPAGIAAMVTLNVLTAVFLDFQTAMSSSEKLFLAGACSIVAASFLAVGIHRRIPTVAAAE